MKITDSTGNMLAQSAKSPGQKPKPEQSFGEVLDQVAQGPVEGSNGSKAGTLTAPLTAFDPVTLLGSASPPFQTEGETPLATGLINELETILCAFDRYREKLGDVSVHVDDLADIIDHLEDRMDRLQTINAASTTPDELKEVTSNLMVTMATEIEKFRRGDYN